MKRTIILVTAAAMTLSACSSLDGGGYGIGGGYSLVRARDTTVGDGSMAVTPPHEWNRVSTVWAIDDIRAVEDWTLNGPYLDSMSFVTGLKGGRYIIRQNKRDAQQVPKFRSDMRTRLNSLYAKYTGQSIEEIEKAMDRDKFLEADEAKEFGLIDEVFEKRPESGDDSGTGAGDVTPKE